MALIDRVKAILLTPKTEWDVIDGEPGDVAGIYKNYLIYLAAIPALAMFIGMSLIGFGAMGITVRVPFFSGLVNAILQYLLSLVMIYVLALIVDALAPTFQGTKNQLAAFKLVAYGSTASMVAGVLYLVPVLGTLAIIGSLYSLYLFYIGLPVLMKCPKEKALPYTAVLIVCSIIAAVLLGVITRPAMRGLGPDAALDGGPAVSLNTPNGKVTIDHAKLDELKSRVDAATRQLDAAGKSGDPAATGKATADVLAALGGATGGREPIPSDALKALLPETVGDMKRDSFDVQSGTAMGVKGSVASASYSNGDRSLELKITDMGSLAGLAAVAAWAHVTGEKETSTSIEKIYKSGNRTVKERADKNGDSAEYSVILSNGVVVEAEGHKVDAQALKNVVSDMDLARLESYKAKS